MSEYFKLKKSVDITVNKDNFEETQAMLNAFFKPLDGGFGAKDVDRFFEECNGASLEDYLKSKRLIASADDFAAISQLQ